MTYAVDVSGTGAVTADIQPQEVFSATDLSNKFGGWDPTIGDFGNSDGNGFLALRSKRFSRLIISPINMASDYGCRFFRELPLCASQTSALPVVPVSGGVIDSGREFNNGTNGRLLAGRRVEFTALSVISDGLRGQTIAGASAATQVFETGSVADQVWQVDDPGVYVDQTSGFNDDTDANFTPFPAAEAIGDWVAIGRAAPFNRVKFDNANGTAGTVGDGIWEYWNGSAWAALTGVTDGTSGFTAAVADGQLLVFTQPSDWAAQVINGSASLYYIRFRITTVYTVDPVYDQGFVGGVDWASITRPDGGQGAKKGDVLVVGNNNGGARQPVSEARTYRVQATPTTGTTITLEEMDGDVFVWTAQSEVPWRLHVSSDADSAPVVVLGATTPGGYAHGDAGGYSVPVRPLTDTTGGAIDGTWTADDDLVPILIPPAMTGSSWDPLSGLAGLTHVTQTLAFDASVQAPNAASDASIDALYQAALTATISDLAPVSEINMIWSARTSSTIRSALRQNCLDAATVSTGRICVVRPELTVQSTSTVVGDTSPGVGATRNERVVYSWPGGVQSVPEAVDTRIKTADGLTTIDGLLDVGFDGFLISIMSNLPPERNPGEAGQPIPRVLAPVLGMQRGVTRLELADYITLRSRGVAALRIDRVVGPILQSGITSSLISGEKNISRRRMADFIQDSLAGRLVQYSKRLLTEANKDNMVSEVDDFLDSLLSLANPAAQRIQAYSVDEKSGNTPESEAAGIFVIISRVRTIPSGDFIVIQTEVGNNVVVTSDLAA
jgi:hypothetical protein